MINRYQQMTRFRILDLIFQFGHHHLSAFLSDGVIGPVWSALPGTLAAVLEMIWSSVRTFTSHASATICQASLS